MLPNVPFWVYMFVSKIIALGGWPLLLLVIFLISTGVIKNAKDLQDWLDKRR